MTTLTAQGAAPREDLPRMDWILAGTVVGLSAFGLLMILSASSSTADLIYGNSLTFVTRQVLAWMMGAGLAMGLLMSPYKWLRQLAVPAFIAAFIGLLLILTPLGVTVNGSRRWLWLGVNLQVSEFAKLALVLVVSDYLARNEGRMHDVIGIVTPIGLFAGPILAAVFFQPDYGTTVVLAGLVGVLLLVAGLKMRWVFLIGGLGLASLGVMATMAEYRMRRITSFLDPFADPSGDGYQVIQGWIAMSTGGWTGRGLGTGVAQSGFLPEAHTDFISAIVAEELGVIGWTLLIGAYIILIWRGMRISERAPDFFGQLLASGITAMLAVQALVNLGVVTGLAPAKGLVLPFMSYGASAILVHTLCAGVLLRISLESGSLRAGSST